MQLDGKVQIAGDTEVSFDVPEEWLVPEAQESGFWITINSPANRCSPFCVPTEGDCFPEAWGGQIFYGTATYDDTDHLIDDTQHLVGEWTWNE